MKPWIRPTPRIFCFWMMTLFFTTVRILGELVHYMESYPQVDILGGRYLDLPLYKEHDFQDMPLFGSDKPFLIAPGTDIGGHVVASKVQNYFIGRTKSIRALKWKPELKVNEHTEFFTPDMRETGDGIS
jgi:hypothetical protein